MIDGLTKVYGVIGYPVKHTFSPIMHNVAFRSLGLNAAYVPFEVKPKNLKEAVLGLKAAGVKGFNVTIPHKERIIKFLDGLNEDAKFVGAVNTVAERDSRFIGFNTDGEGFIDSIKLDVKMALKNKNIFLFGAGGASRAISFSLVKEKVKKIVLVDLDKKKAKGLARLISKTGTEAIAAYFDKNVIREIILNTDLLINATPCGMHAGDPLLVDDSWLHRNLVVYDLIYNPFETKLLKAAKAKRLKAFNGSGMLLRQGARSFELWTNLRAPLEIMRRALLYNMRKK